ncbi:DUF397 domain-containing protein [Actinopolyspora erythraea]|uniref:DUF397 domain-containing protein n=1 Tax=Actinopolyspora erythraea TaxID=414996 RepID=A0A099D3E6_9ACTN|nr:DUF397 domain-containing protein [Actinopolyspora erythraea]ASU77642.1 DUF397 domain-containing protein [Actinopolyspora erythraea]KGI80519.1 hypothetical protein IL38_16735 [Actinopolyspora erythraea]
MVGDERIFRVSSYSGNGANCVEVGLGGDVVAVRDSKAPEHGVLRFSEARWRDFLGALRGAVNDR